MEMMRVFVFNMKKYRKKRGVSQMKLAELVNTSTSYIGEIEINRKVPSMEMVEKIANALNIEPFKLFVDDMNRDEGNKASTDYFGSLTAIERQDLTRRITTLISSAIEQFLQPENNTFRI
jgi:transcriptional regulator with XRE-family HTH domain